MAVPHTTGSTAALLGADLRGPADLAITGVDSLDHAEPGAMTFIRSAWFAERWASSRASAALVTRGIDVPGHDPARRALLMVDDADLAMIRLLELFMPPSTPPAQGVHPTAVVHLTASIGMGVSVGPLCVIGANTRIGEGTRLGAGVVLGADVHIGRRCVLHPKVVVYDRCFIGDHCTLHAHAVIGADGFGFILDKAGALVKVPHVGSVRLCDHVEVGAGACIDRGKFGETLIGAGTKIDNLVQIAHNCRIGRGVALCGQVGLSGSVVVGDGAVLGGQVGVVDALEIGAGARVGAQSGVTSSLAAGGSFLGTPAIPSSVQGRNWIVKSRLAETIQELKSRVRELERELGAAPQAGPADARPSTKR